MHCSYCGFRTTELNEDGECLDVQACEKEFERAMQIGGGSAKSPRMDTYNDY